jgi:hypothetical protein
MCLLTMGLQETEVATPVERDGCLEIRNRANAADACPSLGLKLPARDLRQDPEATPAD